MDNMENIEENYKKLDINREETIRQFDGMYVDFYLEDDMFEVEGQFFTIDGHMEINRVYYLMENPKPDEFKEKYDKYGISEFFLKLTDVMVRYRPEEKKWQITKNKINMYYVGDTVEYDSIEELCSENADIMEGTWQAVIYEAYEEESDFTEWR